MNFVMMFTQIYYFLQQPLSGSLYVFYDCELMRRPLMKLV